MNDLTTTQNRIPAMTDEAVAKVYALEAYTTQMPQIRIDTEHVLHAGVYARTIAIPAGVLLTGALIKCATILIVYGDVCVYIDGEAHNMTGYNVLAASAHRKQAFVAKSDTYLTMIFASKADSVARAEEEFTDEPHLLMSRADGAINSTMITGE